jgi:DNA-binding transcriptional LysR family regulator
LHLSQPALSRSIQSLEQALGVRLLQRQKGRAGIVLTAAGATLAEQARDVLTTVERLAATVSATEDRLPRSHVRFGLGPMLAAELLDHVLGETQRELPDTVITVQVMGQQEMASQLLSGGLDFYIGLAAPERANVRVHSEFVGRLSPEYLVRPGHPLLDHRTVEVEDLLRYPIGSGITWGEPEHSFRNSVDPRVLQSSVRVDNYAILAQLAGHTDMVVIASHEATGGLLKALPVEIVLAQRSSEIYVFSLAALGMSPDAEAVMVLLRSAFELRHSARRQ